jgi:hypothetical protein
MQCRSRGLAKRSEVHDFFLRFRFGACCQQLGGAAALPHARASQRSTNPF